MTSTDLEPDPAPAGAGAGDAVLELDAVSFSYGRLQVLFEVSLTLRQGEALALLGTNGAGKSTLLRVATGLEAPSAGQVSLLGRDTAGVEAEDLVGRGLVLVVGGRSVFTDMTVAENLVIQAFTARRRKAWLATRRDLVFETFPRLAERASQAAGSLSGGEQQQLALAKALLLDPAVLCIDELSLGLAPVALAELLEAVRRIHAAGVSVLLVEQSLNIASELCPRAVFMEKGAVRFEGRTNDLMRNEEIARAVFLGGRAEPDSTPHGRAPGSRPRRKRT